MPVRPAGTEAADAVPEQQATGTTDAFRQFWKTAPIDLRWLAVSMPVILLIVLYSTMRGSAGHKGGSPEPETAPVTVAGGKAIAGSSGEQPGRTAAAPLAGSAPAPASAPPTNSKTFWGKMRNAVAARAAVHLLDDFRGGLGAWDGHAGWAQTWSYDNAGFLRTGALALYTPTLPLADYRMEFLGQIEKRSMGWVYRAENLDNYYASKLVLGHRGAQPFATLVRYMVVGGREINRVEMPLPIAVHNDTVYRVQMDIEGDSFTTYVQGQVVDHFRDTRLTAGGVGFFSSRGDQARMRWIEITHQSDAIGRLCAALVPMNASYGMGSSR